MPWRAEPRVVFWAAVLVAAALLALNLGSLIAVTLWAGQGSGWQAADTAALRFSIMQAALSALVSVALAIPVARALSRRRFPGRGALIALMGAPFILPVLVAVSGLIAVFGRNGWLNEGLALLGLPRLSIYGLQGVVLAHVFLNLPLAVRLILQGWARIPAEHLRLAQSLGFGALARWRHIEAPMLARVVPGALAIVFLICLTSFAVSLTLGGGPRATTLELAIWQAFRFDFDLGHAAFLAAVQAGIGFAALAALALVTRPEAGQGGYDRIAPPPQGGLARGLDTLAIGAAALFLMVPLAMVLVRGLPHVAGLPAPVWAAAVRSVLVAGVSVLLLGGMAAALTLAALHRRWPEALGSAALTASPLVIGLGLFVVVNPLVAPETLALPVTAAVNAAMALPFALRALIPAARRAEAEFARLSASLGMTARDHLRLVLWPRLRRPAGLALGLGAALSLGDLGVIVLFAQTGSETLPMQMHALMGAFRMADAAGVAVLLMAMALGAFAGLERLIGGRDAGA